MPAFFYQVDQDVLDLAEELINEHHPHLLESKIGILFRSESSTAGGRTVLGSAKKPSKMENALLPLEEQLDFLIWLAADWWGDAPDKYRRWLLDHELCHCGPEGKMRPHDVEEFVEIVERHGLMEPALRNLVRVAEQHTIPGLVEQLKRSGAVLSPHTYSVQ